MGMQRTSAGETFVKNFRGECGGRGCVGKQEVSKPKVVLEGGWSPPKGMGESEKKSEET